jgi:hypothetical protein
MFFFKNNIYIYSESIDKYSDVVVEHNYIWVEFNQQEWCNAVARLLEDGG